MATYKTPDVYIEEISLFPPSVAEVETAIPAFIGYTEKAERNGEQLAYKPTKITSMAEYEMLFGGRPPQDVVVMLDTDNIPVTVQQSAKFYMYDSLKMFFNNGGGKCYIISVGPYVNGSGNLTTISKTALIDKGLNALKKYDEPTIIVSPDAVLLSGNDLYEFQQQALQQCADLQDRVVICDLKYSQEENFDDIVEEFRTSIGINNLKYGAAYTPWIKANLERTVHYRDITLKRGAFTGSEVSLYDLTRDNGIRQLIKDLKEAKETVDKIRTDIVDQNTAADINSLEDQFAKAFDEFYEKYKNYLASASEDYFKESLGNIYNLVRDIFYEILILQESLPEYQKQPDLAKKESKDFVLRTDIDKIITDTNLKEYFTTLLHHSNAIDLGSDAKIFTDGDGTVDKLDKIVTYIGIEKNAANSDVNKLYEDIPPIFILTGQSLSALAAESSPPPSEVLDKLQALKDHEYHTEEEFLDALETALSEQEFNTHKDTISEHAKKVAGKAQADIARKTASDVYTNFVIAVKSLLTVAKNYETTFENSLPEVFGLYKNILNTINEKHSEIPPSGAIAGIYAAIDNARGVWKAPANVSLNSVIGPVVNIDSKAQEALNVDVNAGKSINAIRAFTGKGVLVWGARTLAGNDNEWRYISVRRFFNMVEESVKKSTYWAVFEPNNANTWIKVKSMIENYLTQKWRDGALAGEKSDQAFYVKVGLGTTMTAQDILEGRMKVEIGMAVVRPAEFIILKFSHKMQES